MKTTKQILFLLLLFSVYSSFFSQTSETLNHIKTIAGEISPKSIVHNDKGKFFAQNMMYRHTITVYDRSFNKIKTISDEVKLKDFGYSQYLGTYMGSPVECAFSPDGKYAWISNYEMRGGKSTEFNRPGCDGCSGKQYDNSFVYKINTSSYEIEEVIEVGAVPKFLAVTPNNKYVLVSNWTSGDVSVIDVKKNKEIKRIPVGRFPRGIDVNNRSTYAYVAVMGSDKIAKINLVNFKVTWIKNLGSGPRHICISPDDQDLYVSINNESKVLKIDLNTHKIKKIKTGIAPRSMTLSDDGKFLYVVNYQSNTMSKIETKEMDIVDKHSTGTHPIGITFDGKNKNIWVACYTGNIMIFHDSYYDQKPKESAPLIASKRSNSFIGIANSYLKREEDESSVWSLREMADLVEETKDEINVFSYTEFLAKEDKLKEEEYKLKKLEEESLSIIKEGQKKLEEERTNLLNKTISEAESYNINKANKKKDALIDHQSKSIALANQLRIQKEEENRRLAAIKKEKEKQLYDFIDLAYVKKAKIDDEKNDFYESHKKESKAIAERLVVEVKSKENRLIEEKEKKKELLFEKLSEASDYMNELRKKEIKAKEESISLAKELIAKREKEIAEEELKNSLKIEALKKEKVEDRLSISNSEKEKTKLIEKALALAKKKEEERLKKEKELTEKHINESKFTAENLLSLKNKTTSVEKLFEPEVKDNTSSEQLEILYKYLEDAKEKQEKLEKREQKQIEQHTEESLAYAQEVYQFQQKRMAIEKLKLETENEESRLLALEQKIARKDLLKDIKDLQEEYNKHIKQSIAYAEKLLAKIEEQEEVLGEKIIAKESKEQLAEMKSLDKVTVTTEPKIKEEPVVKEVKSPKTEIKTTIKEGAFYAVVGSYGEKKHAIKKQNKFIKKGFKNTNIVYNSKSGLYYVYVDQFESREATQAFADDKGVDVWIYNKK